MTSDIYDIAKPGFFNSANRLRRSEQDLTYPGLIISSSSHILELCCECDLQLGQVRAARFQVL